MSNTPVTKSFSVEERQKYIGGTDAASILGLSRWKTPLQTWSEKTGRVTPEDISGKLAVRLGVKLESTVVEMFEEETGLKTRRVNETIFHPKYSFLGANIDRKLVGQDVILECKTAGARKSSEWDEEEIPAEYLCQCYHYLAVTGYKKAYLAVLIGGNQDFKIKEIDYDKQIIDEMVAKEVKFWNECVIGGQMPAVTSRDEGALASLFPKANEGIEIPLPDDVNKIIESIDSLSEDKKALESQIKKFQNELKAMIKDNEVGVTGLHRIKWANIHTDEYVVGAKDYRKLIISEIKTKGGK